MIDFDLYTTETVTAATKTKYPNAKFQVLNDITKSKFNKHLTDLCKDTVEAAVAVQKAEIAEYDEEYDPEEDENIARQIKNELYTFDTEDNTYKIWFETWAEKDCGTFADVEWLFTYYQPKRADTVILDTFVNAVQNLYSHFNSLESTTGNLTIHFSEGDQEIVDKPTARKLYNYPGTNMYYLQTHRLDKDLTIHDVCIIHQMTF